MGIYVTLYFQNIKKMFVFNNLILFNIIYAAHRYIYIYIYIYIYFYISYNTFLSIEQFLKYIVL